MGSVNAIPTRFAMLGAQLQAKGWPWAVMGSPVFCFAINASFGFQFRDAENEPEWR